MIINQLLNHQQRLRGRKSLFSFVTPNLKSGLENQPVVQHYEIFLPHFSCFRETNWVHHFYSSEAKATFSQTIFSLLNFKLKLISFNVLHLFCLFLASLLLFFPRIQCPLHWVPLLHISISGNLWTFSTSSCQSDQQLVFLFSNRDALGTKFFFLYFALVISWAQKETSLWLLNESNR